jgi:hypothetical protein
MGTVFNKAIVGFLMPALLSGALGILQGVGITGTMTVSTAIQMLLTGAMVWLIPNAKKP